jgi:hypothetical protein
MPRLLSALVLPMLLIGSAAGADGIVLRHRYRRGEVTRYRTLVSGVSRTGSSVSRSGVKEDFALELYSTERVLALSPDRVAQIEAVTFTSSPTW